MNDEQYTQYAVPGAQLRYRVAQLNAAGIPFNVAGQQGGIYIIVVPAPYANGLEHLPQPQRRRTWWRPSRKMLVTLAMVAVVGVGIYMVFSGGIKITGVEVPAVTLPTVANPAAEVNRSVEAAQSAAVTFVWAVLGVVALGAVWMFRGPLMGAARMIGKAVRRG